MKKIIRLTQKLVSIPSWVDATNNENEINNFIYEYLIKNSNLKIEKQILKNGRFNILASNSSKIDRLIIGHTDTVPVAKDWTQDPFKPIIKDGYLYGRGSTDMKGGLASMMLVATNNNLPLNTAFLFYVDEEYSFLGLKKFIQKYQNKLSPKVIISLDGSELEIANGCRGLIEIEVEIKGISCHAATPQFGKNAINIGYQIYQGLINYLKNYSDPNLGESSINLGMIKGGTAPNVVPGSCYLVFDIRPATTRLKASMVEKEIKRIANLNQGKISRLVTNFDFGNWITPKTDLNFGLPFKDISQSGYIDIALLWEAFNKPICFTFGAGTQFMAHKADEYIDISKLNKLDKLLFDLIQKV